jgi:hypothetical protein
MGIAQKMTMQPSLLFQWASRNEFASSLWCCRSLRCDWNQNQSRAFTSPWTNYWVSTQLSQNNSLDTRLVDQCFLHQQRSHVSTGSSLLHIIMTECEGLVEVRSSLDACLGLDEAALPRCNSLLFISLLWLWYPAYNYANRKTKPVWLRCCFSGIFVESKSQPDTGKTAIMTVRLIKFALQNLFGKLGNVWSAPATPLY